MHAKRKGTKRVGPMPPKPVKKVQVRDLSVFARLLRLPHPTSGLSKWEISNDFRSIAGLPKLPEADAQIDPVMNADSKRLPSELREQFPADPPTTIAEAVRDDKPATIAALETATFDDMEDPDYDDFGKILQPSRVMSGWVAARFIAESATRSLLASKTPGLISSLTGMTLPAATSGKLAQDLLAGRIPSAGGINVGPGASLTTGTPLGLSNVRLDMSLRERIVAVANRREERDKQFLALRRYYVAQLRNYQLESKEHLSTLEALRDETAHARAQARPNRSAAFASDEEEWAAVSNLASSAYAVWRQNGQLRARLAELSGRISGNEDDSVDEISQADVFVLKGAAMGGASRKPSKRGRSTTGMQTPLRHDDDGDLQMAQTTADDFRVPRRATPLASVSDAIRSNKAVVLGVGDLVATAYGRGVVIRQRDTDNMVEVKLRWNATAIVTSMSIALLAVAGEEYTGPHKDDPFWVWTAAANPSVEADARPVPSVDEVLIRGAQLPFGKGFNSAVPQQVKARVLAHETPDKSAKRGTVNGVHGSSAYDIMQDMDDEASEADKAVSNVRPRSYYGPARGCVFRSSWGHFGAPRGAPLRIDPSRGIQASGFVVGTTDGIGDAQHVFVPGGNQFPFGGYPAPANKVAEPAMLRSSSTGSVFVGTDNAFTPLHSSRGEPEGLSAPSSAHAGIQPHDEVHHVGSHKGTALQRYQAQVQRLNYQLRTAEESRHEQRARLTEMRQTVSKLLEHLNDARGKLSVVNDEMQRKENEIDNLTSRITRLYERFAPEAEARGWARLQPKEQTAGSTASARSSAEEEAEDGGDAIDMLNMLSSAVGGPAKHARAAAAYDEVDPEADAEAENGLSDENGEEDNDEEGEDDDQEYAAGAILAGEGAEAPIDPDLTQADDAAAALGLFRGGEDDAADAAAKLFDLTGSQDTKPTRGKRSRRDMAKPEKEEKDRAAKRSRPAFNEGTDEEEEGDNPSDGDEGVSQASDNDTADDIMTRVGPVVASHRQRAVTFKWTNGSGAVEQNTSGRKVHVFPAVAGRRLGAANS